MREVISSAEYTASTGAKLVCLILTYSSIDTMSWLGAESDVETVSARYQRWVTRYLLPKIPALQCTAEEIYAARCGILHTMTGDALLHDKRRLRRLGYAWGAANAAEMRKRIETRRLGTKLVAAHIEDLTAGLRLGTADFLEGLQADARLSARVAERSGRFYTNLAADSLRGVDP